MLKQIKLFFGLFCGARLREKAPAWMVYFSCDSFAATIRRLQLATNPHYPFTKKSQLISAFCFKLSRSFTLAPFKPCVSTVGIFVCRLSILISICMTINLFHPFKPPKEKAEPFLAQPCIAVMHCLDRGDPACLFSRRVRK
jgi:hypothetical protein